MGGSSIGDVLLGILSFAPAAGRAIQLGILTQSVSPACITQGSWWLCIFGISLNYLMHGFIWHYPKLFTKLCKETVLTSLGSTPVDVFSALEVVAKLAQAVSLLLYLGVNGCYAMGAALKSSPPWAWLACFGLVAVGQTLNVAMYKAIGCKGVYYGFKLGCEIPWCSSFPFNVGLRHPQYVGVVLCLAGGLTVLMSAELAQLSLPQLVALWALMYVFMSATEQAGDNDKDA
mmetsp:Transcript_16049/g.35925  ORF Transcript_16049/g.35925 Transcript_16049/m.35925 type:complete len:231 (-) Transcript_16049:37-729(-)